MKAIRLKCRLKASSAASTKLVDVVCQPLLENSSVSHMLDSFFPNQSLSRPLARLAYLGTTGQSRHRLDVAYSG